MSTVLHQTERVEIPPAIVDEPMLLVDPSPPEGATGMARACIQSLIGDVPTSLDLTPQLLQFAERHRIRPLLAPLGDTAGVQPVVVLGLQLTAAAEAVISELAAANIQAVVLKGLATGRLDFPTGATRHTGDVDLLVRPADFDRACRLLEARHRPMKDGEPTDLLVERTFATESGIELDVHHRLFRFGPAGTDALMAELASLPDGLGHALDPAGRLVHAAGHLLFAPPGHRRLSSLIDVALIQRRADLDEARVTELADLFGIADLVTVARWAATSLGSTESISPPTIARSAINRAHVRVERSVALETAAVVADQATMRDRLRYVAYQARRHFPRPR